FNLFLFSSSIFVHYSQANKGNFPFCPSICLLQLPYNKKSAPQSICNYLGCALFRFCKKQKNCGLSNDRIAEFAKKLLIKHSRLIFN
ncbi:hypothetical protein VPJ68_01555, partial [Parabacteroides distasonis]